MEFICDISVKAVGDGLELFWTNTRGRKRCFLIFWHFDLSHVKPGGVFFDEEGFHIEICGDGKRSWSWAYLKEHSHDE